ncbi:UdgX family uracil-DNA binding protein [Pseudomonas sp. R2.Fl]|nr:UdgX family uracil-DNA binding protein [Pseudomonas sp. R2.Fl]
MDTGTHRRGAALGTPGEGIPDYARGSGPNIIKAARSDAEDCRRCDLYREATHLVFGEGPADAAVMLVGEQPGDKEDLAARPFVGPAGHLLDECLGEAGLDRNLCYLTNAVKHFKHTLKGKKRLHSRPNTGEVRACAFWLKTEIAIVRPRLIVALGATAVSSLLGPAARVTRMRGTIVQKDEQSVLITIHPSYLLRLRGHSGAREEMDRFIADLKLAIPFQRRKADEAS